MSSCRNTTCKITQAVKTVSRGWNETISEPYNERVAMIEFSRLKKEHPGEYFELIEVEHRETCLEFTAKIDSEEG